MQCANCGAQLSPNGFCFACGAAPTQTGGDPFAPPAGAVPPPPQAPGMQPGSQPGAQPGAYAGQPFGQQPGMYAGMPPAGMPPAGPWTVGYAPPMQWTPVQSLRGLATAVSILLGIMVAIDLVGSIAFFRRAALTSDLLDGTGFPSLDDLDDADDFAEVAFALIGFGSLPLIVVFMIWFYRARSNTEAWYAPQATMSKGWAIGGWFIPLANYVIPMIVANDIWKRSDPQPVDHMGRPSNRVLLWAWWIVFGLSGILLTISLGVRETEEDVEDGDVSPNDYLEALQTGDTLAAVSCLMRIAAAILAILVVQKITRWQNQRLGLEPVAPIGYAPGMPGAPGYAAPQPGYQPGPQPGYQPGPQPGYQPGAQPGDVQGGPPGWGGQQPPPGSQGPGPVDLGKH